MGINCSQQIFRQISAPTDLWQRSFGKSIFIRYFYNKNVRGNKTDIGTGFHNVLILPLCLYFSSRGGRGVITVYVGYSTCIFPIIVFGMVVGKVEVCEAVKFLPLLVNV